MTATTAILDFAAADHKLPETVRADALRLLTDTLASGAAGVASPEAQKLLKAVRKWGNGNDARIIGSKERLPAPSAAFLNGFAIHCLEWDAVHEQAVVHALSTVTATLLATSDSMGGCDEDALLTTLAVGVDIASGLGLSATGAMEFFRPATAGVIGAALAAARLRGISRDQMADVMGLAYSYASGTMQAHVEASIALPLQIANAARCAINAVDMIEAGMNGPHDVLEGPFGYSNLIEKIDLSQYVSTLGQNWRISEVSIKPFPSGRASHGALGALSDIREEAAIGLDDVQQIILRAPPLIERLVGRPHIANMSGSYARLCIPLLAPMMLRDGHIDPRHFDDTGLTDSALATLGAKVKVVLDGNPDTNALGPQHLSLLLKGGSVIERDIAANLGSPEAPMNASQAAQKNNLCRDLADADCDNRIFDKPLEYMSQPK